MDKAKLNTMSLSVKFENFQPINNTGFVRGECKVAYAGKNRNYSNIPKEAFEKAESTIFGIPVVGNWLGDNYGGHDILLETKGNEIVVKDSTTPFGFVPQDANPRWVTVEDENSNSKSYYVVDVILWKERYPDEVQFVIDNGANQSMEIMVTDGEWDNNWEYFNINDFYYSALCLLGREIDESGNKGEKNVEPCFEDSEVVVNKFNMTEKFKKDLFAIKSAFEGGDNVTDEKNKDEVVEDVIEESTEQEFEVAEEVEETSTDINNEEDNAVEEFSDEKDDTSEDIAYSKEEYEELLNNYNELKDDYATLTSEVEELRNFKNQELSKQESLQKDEIINDYSLLLTEDDISIISNEKDKFTLEEIEVKLAQTFAARELEKAKSKADKNKNKDTIIFDNKQKDNKVKKNKFAI